MEWSSSVLIDAAPERVWEVLGDVESWPQWTASVSSIARVDPGPLHVGQRIRIRQPWFPATVWTLTELVEQRSFVWRAGGPGATTTAHHRIEPSGEGTLVSLRLVQQGPVGVLVGTLSSRLTRRYLQMETSGLKQRCDTA
ncbi:carbon monoxide dehydrogenase subunit G [Kibdelosporangium banguiense]|uniref:Carbon monoxide dehydrogenase subunit G n=1 Tax=Kibdelosporangium banguiense TaxID=1365924 RepID=A0ABS4U2R1_9PSEU|nr:SRPBCC family protein [Kibdelosporangium banguiense]MBP2330476.1 carbon monoxide dehydrogenase subunit G [Kibdelosporangium banguiense]